MIFELRQYTFHPGKLPEYLKLNAEVGRKIRGNDYGKFEGGFTTEFGTLNQYVHLWSYPDLNERERLRGELAKNQAWATEYVAKIRPLLLHQQNKILSSVTPFKPPADSGNIYELRTYRAVPGKLAEWFTLTREILPAREKYSRNVGYWETQVSQLNEAVHLWVYRDLNDRAAARGKALQDPEWQAFLAKSLPLLQQQDALVLIPTAVSPMK
ncbi:MAG: NIPSNAP family protein [Candidatus Rokuibacteriota bacterium]|nr:MAG: NIPSNAP family protein [Candidatus Rokubacteria bacterium]